MTEVFFFLEIGVSLSLFKFVLINFKMTIGLGYLCLQYAIHSPKVLPDSW